MKKIISWILFFLILYISVDASNKILVEKTKNTYYMLSEELKQVEDIDVQVYGSCHAYTSFNTKSFSEQSGVSSYNISNAGEIMPATYLRMKERFEKDTPKVAVVETWGINAYETYISYEALMEKYLSVNVENIPISKEKIEVIRDFEALDLLEENFAVLKYKDRLLEFSLSEVDFNYSFERMWELFNSDGENTKLIDIKNRFDHNGFLYNESEALADYKEQQAKVEENELLAIEPIIMKYVNKIIDLCKAYGVELIFYRAPYISTENELRKINYLEKYLRERGVDFYDMEKLIDFDYMLDFKDYQHLSAVGAEKTTQYLSNIILERKK